MTTPTVTPVQDPQAARRETEIRALEAAVAAAVVASLTARLARITSRLRRGFQHAQTRPDKWLAVRREAARDLRSIRPDVGRQVSRSLPGAAAVGARHAGASLPTGYDPLTDRWVADALMTIDQDIARKAETAATAILDGPVDTPAKLADALARVDAPRAEAASTVGDAVARSVAGGAVAAAEADGTPLLIYTERSACLNCKSMAGATQGEDGLFRPVRVFTATLMPWLRAGVATVPLHDHCRCHLAPATPGLADSLRREAEREVARGESEHDSLPARLRAVDRLLAGSSSRLPKTVRARAAADRARGGFSDRHKPAAKDRASRP